MASPAPLALAGFLPAWDIERRRADLRPLAAWVLHHLQSLGIPVDSLESAHRHLDGARSLEVARAITRASAAEEPRLLLVRAVREALPEIPPDRIWLQTHAHVRLLIPGDTRAAFPPHSDFGLGHGLSERNLWFSLTDAEGEGALHVLPLRASLAWMNRTGRVLGVLDDAPEIPPVPTRAGDVLLFTPLHLHRARPPSGPRCRVSIDVRIVPRPTVAPDLSFSPLRGAP